MGGLAKPLVVIGCTPVYGHLMPIRSITKQLIQRGYNVTFVSSSHYRKSLEEIGCTYVSIEGYGDWCEVDIQPGGRFDHRYTLPPGPLQMTWEIENCFVKSIPSQHEAIQKAIIMLREKYPGRPIVQISEGVFLGGPVIAQGAKGVKPTGTIGIGVIPMVLSSIDTAPFGPGLPPDSTPEGRARNKAMTEEIEATIFRRPQTVWEEIYVELGAEKPNCSFFDSSYIAQDRFIQMCTPSAEYPRSDAPNTIRFAGGLPKGIRDAMENPPEWWPEIIQNKAKKDIIFICQGSISLDFTELTIPTMRALAERENTLVVVALGVKGITLTEGTTIPTNARVADFIPFDEILPHSSIFVTNGGYGAFQHGISNGTPMIMAGVREDKPEVSARAEWAGIAVNLRTGNPTEEQIRNAVEEILGNPKYKTRVKEMEAEMATYDPIGIVMKNIDEVAAAAHVNGISV